MAIFEGKELEDEKWRISLIRVTLPCKAYLSDKI
jgi:hypothetical protein